MPAASNLTEFDCVYTGAMWVPVCNSPRRFLRFSVWKGILVSGLLQSKFH